MLTAKAKLEAKGSRICLSLPCRVPSELQGPLLSVPSAVGGRPEATLAFPQQTRLTPVAQHGHPLCADTAQAATQGRCDPSCDSSDPGALHPEGEMRLQARPARLQLLCLSHRS